jgi:hypothetical protein
MKTIKTAGRNWQTTSAGIMALAMIALNAWHNPASIVDPTTIAGISVSIGLILGRDAKQAASDAPAE